jgi:type IV pilus assembly protein PilQ
MTPKSKSNNLVITLRGKGGSGRYGGAVCQANRVHKHALRDFDFSAARTAKAHSGRPFRPRYRHRHRQQGTTLIVDFLKTSLPRNLQRKLDVVDLQRRYKVRYFVQGDNMQQIEPKGWREHAACKLT